MINLLFNIKLQVFLKLFFFKIIRIYWILYFSRMQKEICVADEFIKLPGI